MAKLKNKKTFYRQIQKPILASALAFAGVFNMMSAVLAEGTAAGTPIENTATATYSDGTTTFDAISNTVVINVAEVAGITVSSSGVHDPNGGSVVTDDVITFDFEVTNTGNAADYFFIPGLDNIGIQEGTILRVDIVTPGVPTTAAEAIVPAPQPGASLAVVPNTGTTTEGLTGLPNNGLINPDESITVRVTVEVDADAVGDIVRVQFGNTADNDVAPGADGTQDQQNIPDLSETAANANLDDVRTLNDTTDGATPVNGEREAAAFEVAPFATSVVDLAQALILKSSTVTDATPATPADPSDNSITYDLELQIGNNTFPGIAPGNLEGTDITLEGVAANRILVSDAIPANTTFDPSTPPTVPVPNWTVVYSTDAIAPGGDALSVDWTATQPAPAAITRIGFIYDAVANGALTPSTTGIEFSFTVVTDGLSAPAGGSIANIAQVFGETEGDPGNEVVYDESGDQQFNNQDDGVDPTDNTTNFDPTNDLGVGDINDADPGNNTGTGNDGESTVDTINVPPAGDIFNGPDGTPDAVGPNDTEDDFTNVATTVPVVGAPGTTVDPDPSPVITNELLNPAGAATDLDTVTLVPLSPEEANDAFGTAGDYGVDTDLPDGTQITISFGAQTVTYEYTAGNPDPFHTVGDVNTVPSPVVVGTLVAGVPQDYTVTIDLPAGSEHVEGYGIPIAAFVDNDGNGLFTPGTDATPGSETVSNITVNRVYTGFMELVKSAQVIYAERDGVTLPPTGFLDQAGLDALTPSIRPGDEIEYQVQYINISESAPVGSGNVVLNATDFTIREDGSATIVGVDTSGSATGTNNWASVTLHKTGSAASAGQIEFFDGATPLGTTEPADETTGPSAVTVYENNAGTVAPGATGSMTFIRELQ
ncbi:MAG: hypothetical protein AAFR12_06125 [Cyanobacteria bacterium J06626_6]